MTICINLDAEAPDTFSPISIYQAYQMIRNLFLNAPISIGKKFCVLLKIYSLGNRPDQMGSVLSFIKSSGTF